MGSLMETLRSARRGPAWRAGPVSRGIAAMAAIVALGWLMAAATAAEPDRTVLPLPEPPREASTILDARDATPPPFFTVKAPEGAPNVLLILIDDLGFGGTSAFGGPVATPSFDRMAKEGLAFSNFHTQATCSPTRASMLSGHNHHAVNMGGIAEAGTAFPGNTTRIPNETASIAEILRLNGYNTAALRGAQEGHPRRCARAAEDRDAMPPDRDEPDRSRSRCRPPEGLAPVSGFEGVECL